MAAVEVEVVGAVVIVVAVVVVVVVVVVVGSGGGGGGGVECGHVTVAAPPAVALGSAAHAR
jgi:hypothetical protein